MNNNIVLFLVRRLSVSLAFLAVACVSQATLDIGD